MCKPRQPRYYKPSRFHNIKNRKRQRRNKPRKHKSNLARFKHLRNQRKIQARLNQRKQNNQLYLDCKNEIRRQRNQQTQLLNALFGIDESNPIPDNTAYVIDTRKNHPLSFENSINQPLNTNLKFQDLSGYVKSSGICQGYVSNVLGWFVCYSWFSLEVFAVYCFASESWLPKVQE